mmetsp:Transcript_29074/g.56175  ORF Transcript_29074/g.56175 Transcript_29074/m.56175 type:complete len:828 (-) Transcript_29074:56-2539(-)
MAAQFSEGWSGTPMWQLKQEREEQQKKEQRQREAQAGDLLTIEREGEAFRSILVVSRLEGSGAFNDTKCRGPRRRTRAEAVKDGLLLRAACRGAKEAERAAVVQRQCHNLQRKQWRPEELPAEDTAVEEATEEPMRQRLAAKPRGNGWQRVGDKEFFKHAYAPLAFDSKRRRYLHLDEVSGQYSECDPPHEPMEYSVTVAASASLVGRSDEDVTSPLRPRTLILKELVKTGAAMKQPLYFLDQPAACFVLLDGVRGGSASEWCSRQIHTKLLPRLSASVAYWSDSSLGELLSSILVELDTQLLQQPGCCWDGVSIAVALLLGSRLVVASLGLVRVLLLTPDNSWQLLGSRHDMSCEEERLRVEACSGAELSRRSAGESEQQLVQKPAQERQWEAVEAQGTEEEVQRILVASPDAFATLCLEPSMSEGVAADGKAARSAYKRLALRVHPDKVPENLKAPAKEAFEKIEAAAAAVEAFWDSDAAAAALLHRVLHVAGATGAVVSRAVAAAVLGLSVDASSDEARYRQHELFEQLQKLGMLTDGGLAYPEQKRGAWILEEAAEAFAAPPIKDQSATALQAVRPTRALGLRDLKLPRPLLLAQPHLDVVHLEQEGIHHLALLSSCTAALADGEVFERIRKFQKHPKAASLSVAADAAARIQESGTVGPSTIAGCLVAVLCVGGGPEAGNTGADQEMEPNAKRARKDANSGRKVRAQHILLKHKELKSKIDPEAHLRQKGPVTRPLAEAERELLRMKNVLTSDPKQFHVFARKHSECKSCLQPGQLAGDLGWVSRGSLGDPALEEMVLGLEVHELSDLVSTPRGLHIIHRYA